MNYLSTEYQNYMQSEAWNTKRLERLRIDGYVCQDCGHSNKPLDVHHLTYDRFRNEWMGDLLSVCRRCHNYRHGKIMVSVFNCPTCLKFIPITIQKIRIRRYSIMKLKCSLGHIKTFNDDSDNADFIKRYLL